MSKPDKDTPSKEKQEDNKKNSPSRKQKKIAKKKKKAPLFLRLLRWVFITLFLIIIFLGGLGYFFLATEKGSLTLKDITNHYFSDYLTIGEIEGRLLSQLTLEEVVLHLPHQGDPFVFDKIKLAWEPRALTGKHLKIDSLTLEGASLPLEIKGEENLQKEKEAFSFYPFSFEKISYPYLLTIDELSLKEVDFRLPEEDLTLYTYDFTAHALHYNEERITIEDFALTSDLSIMENFFPLVVKGGGKAELLTDHLTFDLNAFAFDSIIEGHDFNFAFNSRLEGPLNKLELTLDSRVDWLGFLEDPIIENIRLTLTNQEEVSGTIHIHNLSNVIDLEGHWSLRRPLELNANLEIDAPKFEEIRPFFQGSAHGVFDINGFIFSPLVKSELSIRDFEAFGMKVGALDFNATHDNEKMLTAKLFLDSLILEDLDDRGEPKGENLIIDSITLDAIGDIRDHLKSSLTINEIRKQTSFTENIHLLYEGSLLSHTLAYTSQNRGDTLEFAGEGSLDLEAEAWQWRYHIDKTVMKSDFLGNYQLQKAATLKVGPGGVSLTSYCLAELPFSFCLEGSYTPDSSVGVLTLRNLPLDYLYQYLPENIVVDTKANAVFAGQFTDLSDFKGIGELSLNEGGIELMLEGRKVLVPLKKSVIRLDAAPELITGNVDFDWGNYLEIDGELSIQNIMKEHSPLVGKIYAHIPNFDWVAPIFPYLQDITGTIFAESYFAGLLKQPVIHGNFGINEGALYLPETNTRIEAINLRGNFIEKSSQVEMTGSLKAGSGLLNIDSQLNYQTLAANATIKGENLTLANTDLMKVIASPNLTVTMRDGRYELQGVLDIPTLNYIHESAQGVQRGAIISASPDVVIISKNERKKESAIMDQLAMKVAVNLGDNIMVGMGNFLVTLNGGVEVLKEYNNPIGAQGVVAVEGGDLSIYGQRLTLDKGQILFSGGLITNPSLEVQASRRVVVDRSERQANVGVRVTGTVKRPRIRLFSTPSMDDLEVASYLFLGRAPNFESPTENLMLLNMIRKIASGEDPGAETMADKVGLTDFGFTQDYLGNTALGLGKQMTDRLYLGVGVGIEDDSSGYGMARYRFWKYFSLEGQFTTDSGTSADLIYSRDF